MVRRAILATAIQGALVVLASLCTGLSASASTNTDGRGREELALTACESNDADASSNDDRWELGDVRVSPRPVLIGEALEWGVSAHLTSPALSNVSTADIFVRVSIDRKDFPEEIFGFFPLCTVLLSGEGTDECPRLPVYLGPEEKYAFELHSHSPPLSLPGADRLAPGLYDVEITVLIPKTSGGRSALPHVIPDGDDPLSPSDAAAAAGNLTTCVAIKGGLAISSGSVRDVVNAFVAFAVASAASWTLGRFLPLVGMPLITGYLAVGILVGPYATNLVTVCCV